MCNIITDLGMMAVRKQPGTHSNTVVLKYTYSQTAFKRSQMSIATSLKYSWRFGLLPVPVIELGLAVMNFDGKETGWSKWGIYKIRVLFISYIIYLFQSWLWVCYCSLYPQFLYVRTSHSQPILD